MSGAKTIVLDILEQNEANEKLKGISQKDYKIIYEKFDTADLDIIENKMDLLFKKFGKPDIWINNAYPRTKDWGKGIEDLKIDSWRKNIDMHMNSYSWISRYVCIAMKSNEGGSLINMASIYGLVGNDFSVYKGTNINPPMAYAAIKAGIINLSRYLASHFGPFNIRVNNICPGGIFDSQDKNFVVKYSDKTPLKRMGNASEIAPAVIFLSSDAASYITGETLIIDGGWTAI